MFKTRVILIIKLFVMASFVVNRCYTISCRRVDINCMKRCEWGDVYLMFVDPSLRDILALIVNNV